MKAFLFLTIFTGLFLINGRAQCDLATSGMTVVNGNNTLIVSSICIGQKANFKFSVLNFGASSSCSIPVNTAQAVFSFPSAYNYAGPASFSSGYFTWTYNGSNRTIVGLNSLAIPQYFGDSVLIPVTGVTAATQTSTLTLTQLSGISDNSGNNSATAQLTVAVAPVASINYPSSSYCPSGSAFVTQTGQGGGSYRAEAGLSINSTTGAINLSASSPGSYTVKYVFTNGQCTDTARFALTVKAKTSSVSNVTVCTGQLPYIWNGSSYSSAGTYTWNGINAAGCDSLATLNLTVISSVPGSSQSTTACNSYSWYQTTYSQSGTYTRSYVNANGCNVTDTLRLVINPNTSSNTSAVACNSQLPYIWNGTSYSATGTYTKTISNSQGCDSVMILQLTVTGIIPSAPSSITQTLLVNVCGGRIYRYSAPTTTGAFGFSWIIPTSVGGVSGVIVDSGDITRSQVIRLKYASNNAALSTDSIFVRANSPCGNSAYRSAKLNVTSLSAPAAPSSITITAVQTNVCGARIYRYAAPALPAGTTATVAATGYLWSFTGILGANAVIDSGTSGSRVIRVRFTSNAAAVAGDSVRVLYLSSCGNSNNRSVKLTNTFIGPPAAPSSITITAVQTNVCGARIYRYAAPALPGATTTTVAATGYLWSFTGTLGANAVIDSGTSGSQVIRVRYSSNAAAAAGDSVRVLYLSSCGNSNNRSVRLTNTVIGPPAPPSSISITAVQTNVCGARIYRYAAPALPAATTTTVAATGYLWSFTGTLGLNAVIDSGATGSRVIRVRYSSNSAAVTGDSVRVLFLSSCGNSANRSVKLTNTALNPPAAPSSITISIVSDACGSRIFRYAAPALPAATSSTGAATGYIWTMPTGPVGSTGVLDSGSLTGQVIRIRYSSNEAAVAGDSIRVQYSSGCGNSAVKSQFLSNRAKSCIVFRRATGSAGHAQAERDREEGNILSVFPNPGRTYIYLTGVDPASGPLNVKLTDYLGRHHACRYLLMSGKIKIDGSDLLPGIYFIEIWQGKNHFSARFIKQ